MPRPRRTPSSFPERRSQRPIFALLTDFGTVDSYVAEMKGVLLRALPNAQILDVTHQIAPQDVLSGSIVLERALSAMPAGTIHLAVVDPGVGSARKILWAELRGQHIVCPDNGLITWAWRRHPGGRASEIRWRPAEPSHTFHGRDIMAPAAARIAAGAMKRSWSNPLADPVLLEVAPARSLAEAKIIHVDRFGNVTTNVPVELLNGSSLNSVQIGRRTIRTIGRTYSDVDPGQLLVLIGSSGLVEIAQRNGSAAATLRAKPGMALEMS